MRKYNGRFVVFVAFVKEGRFHLFGRSLGHQPVFLGRVPINAVGHAVLASNGVGKPGRAKLRVVGEQLECVVPIGPFPMSRGPVFVMYGFPHRPLRICKEKVVLSHTLSFFLFVGEGAFPNGLALGGTVLLDQVDGHRPASEIKLSNLSDHQF